jgi:hypothetical protein
MVSLVLLPLTHWLAILPRICHAFLSIHFDSSLWRFVVFTAVLLRICVLRDETPCHVDVTYALWSFESLAEQLGFKSQRPGFLVACSLCRRTRSEHLGGGSDVEVPDLSSCNRVGQAVGSWSTVYWLLTFVFPSAAAATAGRGSNNADTTGQSSGPNAHPVGYNHHHDHVDVAPTLAASYATSHATTPGPAPRSSSFCPDAASVWVGTWSGESPWVTAYYFSIPVPVETRSRESPWCYNTIITFIC